MEKAGKAGDEGMKKLSKKFAKIDVSSNSLKQFSLVFQPGIEVVKRKRAPPKSRSAAGKAKAVDDKNTNGGSSKVKHVFRKPADVSGSASRCPGRKGISLSRKKSEVLGNLNGRNDIVKTSPEENSAKREKRKRFGGDDISEIAAENIPVEKVFPALQFGLVNENCPEKRRCLQSLISPQSPNRRFKVGSSYQ